MISLTHVQDTENGRCMSIVSVLELAQALHGCCLAGGSCDSFAIHGQALDDSPGEEEDLVINQRTY